MHERSRLRPVRALLHVPNRVGRRRLSELHEPVVIDNSQSACANLLEFLYRCCHPINGCRSRAQKLLYLNALASLLRRTLNGGRLERDNGDASSLHSPAIDRGRFSPVISTHEIALCLRTLLVLDSGCSQVRAGAWRVLRVLVRTRQDVCQLLSPPLLLDQLIVRSLELVGGSSPSGVVSSAKAESSSGSYSSSICDDNDDNVSDDNDDDDDDDMSDGRAERLQALQLARTILSISPDQFPHSITRCLLAIIEDRFTASSGAEPSNNNNNNGADSRVVERSSAVRSDRCWCLAVATLCQLAVQAGGRLVACGGHRTLATAALQCRIRRVVSVVVVTLVQLADKTRTCTPQTQQCDNNNYNTYSEGTGVTEIDYDEVFGRLLLPLVDTTFSPTASLLPSASQVADASALSLTSSWAVLTLMQTWSGLLRVGFLHRDLLRDVFTNMSLSTCNSSTAPGVCTDRKVLPIPCSSLLVCQRVLQLLVQLLGGSLVVDFNATDFSQLYGRLCLSFVAPPIADNYHHHNHHGTHHNREQQCCPLLACVLSRCPPISPEYHRPCCLADSYMALLLQIVLECGLLESLVRLVTTLYSFSSSDRQCYSMMLTAAVLLARALWLIPRLLAPGITRQWHSLPQLLKMAGSGSAVWLADVICATDVCFNSHCVTSSTGLLPSCDSSGDVTGGDVSSCRTPQFVCDLLLQQQLRYSGVTNDLVSTAEYGNARMDTDLASSKSNHDCWQKSVAQLVTTSGVTGNSQQNWDWNRLAALIDLLRNNCDQKHHSRDTGTTPPPSSSSLSPPLPDDGVCSVLSQLCTFLRPSSRQFSTQQRLGGDRTSSSAVGGALWSLQTEVLTNLLEYLTLIDERICAVCARLLDGFIVELCEFIQAAICAISSTPSSSLISSASSCASSSSCSDSVSGSMPRPPLWAEQMITRRSLSSTCSCCYFIFTGRLLSLETASSSAVHLSDVRNKLEQLVKAAVTADEHSFKRDDIVQIVVGSLDYRCANLLHNNQGKSQQQHDKDTELLHQYDSNHHMDGGDSPPQNTSLQHHKINTSSPHGTHQVHADGTSCYCWSWQLLLLCSRANSSSLRLLALRQLSVLVRCQSAAVVARHGVTLAVELLSAALDWSRNGERRNVQKMPEKLELSSVQDSVDGEGSSIGKSLISSECVNITAPDRMTNTASDNVTITGPDCVTITASDYVTKTPSTSVTTTASDHVTKTPSTSVTTTASDRLIIAILQVILDELCTHRFWLEALAASRLLTILTQLTLPFEDNGALVLARLAGTRLGFERFSQTMNSDISQLDSLLVLWSDSGSMSLRYTRLMERQSCEMWPDLSSSNRYILSHQGVNCACVSGNGNARCVRMLPHLYGQLFSHSEGAQYIEQDENPLESGRGYISRCLKCVVSAVEGVSVDSDRLKSALWCLGSVAFTERGAVWLLSTDTALRVDGWCLVRAVTTLFTVGSCPMDVRAVCYLVLGLCASSEVGSVRLQELGWHATSVDRWLGSGSNGGIQVQDSAIDDDYDDEGAGGVQTAVRGAVRGHRRAVSELPAPSRFTAPETRAGSTPATTSAQTIGRRRLFSATLSRDNRSGSSGGGGENPQRRSWSSRLGRLRAQMRRAGSSHTSSPLMTLSPAMFDSARSIPTVKVKHKLALSFSSPPLRRHRNSLPLQWLVESREPVVAKSIWQPAVMSECDIFDADDVLRDNCGGSSTRRSLTVRGLRSNSAVKAQCCKRYFGIALSNAFSTEMITSSRQQRFGSRASSCDDDAERRQSDGSASAVVAAGSGTTFRMQHHSVLNCMRCSLLVAASRIGDQGSGGDVSACFNRECVGEHYRGGDGQHYRAGIDKCVGENCLHVTGHSSLKSCRETIVEGSGDGIGLRSEEVCSEGTGDEPSNATVVPGEGAVDGFRQGAVEESDQYCPQGDIGVEIIRTNCEPWSTSGHTGYIVSDSFSLGSDCGDELVTKVGGRGHQSSTRLISTINERDSNQSSMLEDSKELHVNNHSGLGRLNKNPDSDPAMTNFSAMKTRLDSAKISSDLEGVRQDPPKASSSDRSTNSSALLSSGLINRAPLDNPERPIANLTESQQQHRSPTSISTTSNSTISHDDPTPKFTTVNPAESHPCPTPRSISSKTTGSHDHPTPCSTASHLTESQQKHSCPIPGSTSANPIESHHHPTPAATTFISPLERETLFRSEVLRLASLLSTGVASRSAELALLNLKRRHAHRLRSDLCLYTELCHVISEDNYGSRARRFLHELFEDVLFGDVVQYGVSVLEMCRERVEKN